MVKNTEKKNREHIREKWRDFYNKNKDDLNEKRRQKYRDKKLGIVRTYTKVVANEREKNPS